MVIIRLRQAQADNHTLKLHGYTAKLYAGRAAFVTTFLKNIANTLTFVFQACLPAGRLLLIV